MMLCESSPNVSMVGEWVFRKDLKAGDSGILGETKEENHEES